MVETLEKTITQTQYLDPVTGKDLPRPVYVFSRAPDKTGFYGKMKEGRTIYIPYLSDESDYLTYDSRSYDPKLNLLPRPEDVQHFDKGHALMSWEDWIDLKKSSSPDWNPKTKKKMYQALYAVCAICFDKERRPPLETIINPPAHTPCFRKRLLGMGFSEQALFCHECSYRTQVVNELRLHYKDEHNMEPPSSKEDQQTKLIEAINNQTVMFGKLIEALVSTRLQPPHVAELEEAEACCRHPQRRKGVHAKSCTAQEV